MVRCWRRRRHVDHRNRWRVSRAGLMIRVPNGAAISLRLSGI